MDSETPEVANGDQIDSESAALEAPRESPKQEDRRERSPKWNVPPGGVITTGAGYLSRNRPDTPHHQWSSVSVGPVAARELSEGLDERDHLILVIAEQLGVVTAEQIERALFDSSVTARNHIRLLRKRRFLASLEVDHRMVSAAVGHRAGMHNAPLVLDWNGKYLLDSLHYDLGTWDPSTVAQVNSQFGHTLGVGELWSYVVAAARATHEPVLTTASSESARDEQAKVRDQLSVGFLNERESTVYYEGRTGWSLEMEEIAYEAQQSGTAGPVGSKRDQKSKASKYRALLKPDATLVLSIRSNETERAYQEAASKSNSKSPCSYRGSWHDALLTAIPSPASMRAAEHLGSTRYRLVFLEMETGSNSSKDVMHKIERYNQLLKRLKQGDVQGQNWRAFFGPTAPPIVVAVRDSSQVDGQVMLWRSHYVAKSPGTLILANLELLALAYAKGRYNLLAQPCWLDVMRSEGPKRRTLREILGLRL